MLLTTILANVVLPVPALPKRRRWGTSSDSRYTFTVVKSGDGCEVVIGYSSTNTNRVNIPVESTSCDVDTPITFNANLFKEVLVANRECSSAVLEVSTEGLARVNFKIDDFDSTYYIVAMQDVD